MIGNNYQQQIPYGAVKDVVPQQVNERLPQSVQNFDTREAVNNNTVIKAAKNANTDLTTVGLTGAIWLLFAQIGQKLNNSLGQDWDKSWLGKIGSGAENIAKKLHLTKSEGKIKAAKTWLGEHSKVLRSFATPTKPQNTFMAIPQSRGITGYVMSDVSSMLGSHLKNGYGDDILKVVKEIKPDFAGATGKEALEYIDDIFKNCENNKGQIDKLIKSLSEKDFKISVDKIFGKIPNIPFLKRKGSSKELANKLNAVFGNEVLGKQTTALGKAAPKQAIKSFEGLTNAGAGGKLMIVMQAVIFAQAIKKAMDAPKGEKISTFTENIANDFGFFLSLPYQVNSSHSIGGLKYIGIGKNTSTAQQKEFVAKYHTMIKDLNEKVSKGVLSKIDYVKEKETIKTFLKGDAKWYHKPIKAIGRFFSTGLDAETIKPFVDKADKSFAASAGNFFKKIVNKIKGPGIGSVIRFGVAMMVVGPLIAKVATKISHLIFGRPTKSVLDEDKEEKPVDGAKNPSLNMSEEEFKQKLAQNPELIKKMETDPQFTQQLLNNPQMLVQILNGEVKLEELLKEDPGIKNSKYIINNQNQTQAANTPQGQQTPQLAQPQAQQPQAQANGSSMSALPQEASNSQMDLFGLGKKNKEKEQQKEETNNASTNPDEPARTYVPSSKSAVSGTQEKQDGLDPKISSAISTADAVEAQALERLGAA